MLHIAPAVDASKAARNGRKLRKIAMALTRELNTTAQDVPTPTLRLKTSDRRLCQHLARGECAVARAPPVAGTSLAAMPVAT
jgi:hypothetical protein